MKIVDQLVKVNIGPSNITYYKNKGYNVNFGDVITVPVSDLTNCCSIKVKCICEQCGKTGYIQFGGAKKNSDICRSCNARNVTNEYATTRVGKGNTRESIKGDKNPNWKGGISALNHLIRTSQFNKAWIYSVFERDNFTCQNCGDDRGHNLNAHHIVHLINLLNLYKITKENWLEYKDVLFDINNGVTLCKECHIKEHKKWRN